MYRRGVATWVPTPWVCGGKRRKVVSASWKEHVSAVACPKMCGKLHLKDTGILTLQHGGSFEKHPACTVVLPIDQPANASCYLHCKCTDLPPPQVKNGIAHRLTVGIPKLDVHCVYFYWCCVVQ